MKKVSIFIFFLSFICMLNGEDSTAKSSKIPNNFIEHKHFKIPIVKVTKQNISDKKSYYAKLEPLQANIVSVTTRIDGFLQKFFVNEIYSKVEKNTPLFSFYSPELIDAQSEFLVTMSYNHSHLARQKLELLGVNSKEIAKLQKTRKIINEITFYSPLDGVVFAKNFNTGSGVKKGDEIFRIINLEKLWVVANVNQEDLEFIKTLESNNLEQNTSKNSKNNNIKIYALIDTLNNSTKKVKIKFDIIYPNITNNFAQVRFILDNKNAEFFPNMFAKTQIESTPKMRLTLPKSAILYKNKSYFVFVEDDGEFIAQEINARRILGSDFYEIIDGLDEGDVVAKNALFMLDSDAQNNGYF